MHKNCTALPLPKTGAFGSPFFLYEGGTRVIELKNISKVFGSGEGQVHAIDDVTLSIDKGEIFGIIGFSGAGKSTLVRCINLLEVPTGGRVIVDSKELTTLSPRELRSARKGIGMIFQHFNLMPSRTVFGNVAFPLKGSSLSREEKEKKVRELLRLVDIEDKENAYPNQLSGGQKQRVAIARALANDPKVLLCDEATSALDPQTTKSILQLLKKVNKQLGITVVVITHEMAVIKEICGRVAVMEKGRVVEEGEVFSIFANPREPVTRDFIRTTSNLHKIEGLLAENSPVTRLKPGEMIVRLSYVEKNVSEPLISTVSRTFDIDLNIIFSDIEIVQDAPIGGTVAIMSGERDQIALAMKYLAEKNVGVEVIQDAGTA
jgi:D-methionine transport system ATP-binding protein